MNVLVVGAGAGSWTIRGVQLGAAIGARVTSAPTPEEWRWASVAVLVKRAAFVHAPAAHAAGVPIVWDALDYWRQPADNHADADASLATLQAHLVAIRPALVIGATQAHADAADGVHVPHHARPGLMPRPVRKECRLVAYEGNAAYLGRWDNQLRTACARRGWSFAINPPDPSVADLIVAFRDGPWDGYQCRQWKSGVKVVNALIAGRPIVTQDSAAFREIGAPGSVVETVDALETALDTWAPASARQRAYDEAQRLAPRYALTAVAAQYAELLDAVRMPCPA